MFNLRWRTSEGSSPETVLAALRDAARFDSAAVSIAGGLLAAIPVVALLGGALAAGDKVAAVTMGAGAMLVGTAWRTGGGRPPLALMATDACLMALSTFVGSATGSHHWVHLTLLCLWSLVGGLLIALGRRGGVLGTQAIISVVVFGRFSEPPAAALGLAGLVLAGGLAQVAFLSVVRWPYPLRLQRQATAGAFRALGQLAASPHGTSGLPAAASLDEAQAALSSGTLFGDPVIQTLRSLVGEGYRVRVHLTAVHGLIQLSSDGDHLSDASRSLAENVLASVGTALATAAQVIEGDGRAVAELDRLAATIGEQLRGAAQARDPSAAAVPQARDSSRQAVAPSFSWRAAWPPWAVKCARWPRSRPRRPRADACAPGARSGGSATHSTSYGPTCRSCAPTPRCSRRPAATPCGWASSSPSPRSSPTTFRCRAATGWSSRRPPCCDPSSGPRSREAPSGRRARRSESRSRARSRSAYTPPARGRSPWWGSSPGLATARFQPVLPLASASSPRWSSSCSTPSRRTRCPPPAPACSTRSSAAPSAASSTSCGRHGPRCRLAGRSAT